MFKYNPQLSLLATLFAVVLGCGEVESPTIEPAPHKTKAPPTETPMITLDDTTDSHELIVHGPPNVRLVARLVPNTGGQRELVLVDTNSSAEQMLASADWNYPGVAAIDGSGRIFACWNRLTGPSTNGAPQPHQGMELRCRLGTFDGLSAPLVVEAEVPSWLSNIKPDANGQLELTYIKTNGGHITSRPVPGDGVFKRTLNGAELGRAVLVRGVR